jgi:hypothetical protein
MLVPDYVKHNWFQIMLIPEYVGSVGFVMNDENWFQIMLNIIGSRLC